jgi:ketosteroid isomerase-like protein
MGAEDERSVRGLAEAINRQDVEAAVAVCDPEIEFLSVLAVSGKAYRGHDGIRQYFEDIASAWQKWKVEVHRVAPRTDGRVVIEMTMHMQGKGSGAALSERTAHIWTLRDSKLLRNRPLRTAGPSR